ncbi:MAG: glycosyltransferase [Gammaproteobacteria bacterium]|jgi:glycosyltransferase involved in cell wall biosynthesis|nr:glycosyltransferase [Gammaproteobacteria bacterium]MBT3722594.1 glycosyltransferase [Gammaproteobacteria bacterium]MBT4193214.1 glycosyltransferase [Gammaproteobacteria bacterium]MBT4451075.1 glycosyltransferase [Gammaproteobacteria bacterium]MBT4862109.1 glycosyltransferase [Gammaproteobacteria bacterium]
MQISVIIPSFNRERTLIRALNSVLNQSSKADEVIVVDDGSSDNTSDIVRQKFPSVKLIQQTNRGVSHARNTGIKNAQFEWLALLDSDDEWLPEKLANIRQQQLNNPEEILFHSDEIWIRNGTRVNQMNKHAKYGGMIFEQCLPLCVISPSAVVIHRSIFEQIGLFNEDLPACEDYDFWLRLCHRFPVFYIDKPLIKKYGGHEDQLSRKFWGMDRFRIRALHQLMALPTLQTSQQEQALKVLLKKLRILIKGAHKHKNLQLLQEFQPLLDHYEQLQC